LDIHNQRFGTLFLYKFHCLFIYCYFHDFHILSTLLYPLRVSLIYIIAVFNSFFHGYIYIKQH
jgi:hypothetical protein